MRGSTVLYRIFQPAGNDITIQNSRPEGIVGLLPVEREQDYTVCNCEMFYGMPVWLLL